MGATTALLRNSAFPNLCKLNFKALLMIGSAIGMILQEVEKLYVNSTKGKQ